MNDYQQKLQELAELTTWFKNQGEVHLAAALLSVQAVAGTGDPVHLTTLVHLLDRYIKKIIRQLAPDLGDRIFPEVPHATRH